MYKKAVSAVKSLLFPSFCSICNKILIEEELGICKNCRDELIKISQNVCYRCGRPISYTGLCPECENNPKPRFWDKRRSVYIYNDPMAELVHQFKYNNNLDLLKYFSKILKAEFHKYFKASEIDKIIPVPVSKQRMQKRGYNQAKKLLDEFNINISDKTVIRMKHTKPQSLYQKKKKRKLNIKNAFKVIKDVSNEKVVIVDDLVTTGATLNEISKALYKKGAEKIYHLTLIRAR